MQPPTQTVEFILDLFRRFGHYSYGEQLSQISHMVQAAELAAEDGQSEEVVLAALLHDIGHLLGDLHASEQMGEGLGAVQHESLGADWLRKAGFSETVAILVEGHVAAKRYLTWKNPSYQDALSEASKQTLIAQGGPMNEEEGKAFAHHSLFEVCLKMRHWDDEAKQTNLPEPDLLPYRELMLRHLTAQQ
ncbi:MAG: HD domain-containing protein [Bacteroidota bacterium]